MEQVMRLRPDLEWAYIEECISKMTPEQREHFQLVVLALIRCYVEKDMRAFVVTSSPDSATADINNLAMYNINSDPMSSASMLRAASDYVYENVMEDAPESALRH